MSDVVTFIVFILLAGLAIGSALAMVAQRNPLYSAISLIGVFVALAGLYLTLAAPFIAAVQIIVYAGAIMVLVVFVIMLLNVEEEVRRPVRLRYLVPTAVLLAAVLFAEAAFILFYVNDAPAPPSPTRISAVRAVSASALSRNRCGIIAASTTIAGESSSSAAVMSSSGVSAPR